MKTNIYILHKKYATLIIYRKTKKTSFHFLIDKEDVERISKHQWSVTYSDNQLQVYARNDSIGKLHQFILGKKNGKHIDHINGNTLDNRKKNLRHVNFSENAMNKDSVGVYFANDRQQWRALIQVYRKKIHLGSFSSRELALKARRKAEKKYFGVFARNRRICA